jgi:hypothetical protein
MENENGCVLDKLGHHATGANRTFLTIGRLRRIVGTHLVKPEHLLVCNDVVGTAA